jgi:hypothetical protein
MPSWGEFVAAQPELAAKVQERFAIRKHKTLATVRADGAPRISGIEAEFADGQLSMGMMPGSRKLQDLRRDPRIALHSPTEDPPQDRPTAWQGEAKISGRAVEVAYPNPPVAGAGRVQVDIEEVVFTHLNSAGNRLVIESWRPGAGYRRLERE